MVAKAQPNARRGEGQRGEREELSEQIPAATMKRKQRGQTYKTGCEGVARSGHGWKSRGQGDQDKELCRHRSIGGGVQGGRERSAQAGGFWSSGRTRQGAT